MVVVVVVVVGGGGVPLAAAGHKNVAKMRRDKPFTDPKSS